MRHHKIKKKLSQLVDGLLSLKEENIIKKHLAGCLECQNLFSSFNRLGDLYGERDFKVNPFFAQRVMANLKSRRSEGFWQVFDFIPRPVILTGLALSIITLSIFGTPLYQLTDEKATELAVLYAESSDLTQVTDDQALAIIINAQDTNTTGE